MKAALVLMAAGLGSRYGGNKQVDGVGPCGEILMEYCIHDAIRAGFTKVVFIIKPDMVELMEPICPKRLWESYVEACLHPDRKIAPKHALRISNSLDHLFNGSKKLILFLFHRGIGKKRIGKNIKKGEKGEYRQNPLQVFIHKKFPP